MLERRVRNRFDFFHVCETLISSALWNSPCTLVQMNLQLPLVVSDITGVTGLRIVRDIVAGRREAQHLAEHRDHRCRASTAEIVAALTGHYRPEHLFVLQQNLERFDRCQAQMVACDRAIDAHVHTLTAALASPTTPVPAPRITQEAAGQRTGASRFARPSIT